MQQKEDSNGHSGPEMYSKQIDANKLTLIQEEITALTCKCFAISVIGETRKGKEQNKLYWYIIEQNRIPYIVIQTDKV